MGMHLRMLPLTSGLASAGRHLARLAAAAAVAIGVTACLDGETTIGVDSDGRTRIDYEMRFDKEAEDVFVFFKALGDVSPEAAMLKLGICPAASMLPALVPEFKGHKVTGSEHKTDTSYVCKIGFDIGPIADFTALIAKLDPWGMYEVTEVGPRRYQLAIDYGKMPDMSEIMKEVARRQQEAGKKMPDQLEQKVMDQVSERSVKAGIALVRLMAKNRRSDLVISAGQIVESNGEIAPDRKSARFSMTTDEAVTLLLKPEARAGKRFYAVVEY